jgi:cytochrome c-type biogenesis protein CcmH/NrfF
VTRFALLALVFLTFGAGAASAGPREVEERLACQCGCGLTVHTCNHLQCSFAVPVREDVAKSLAAGQSEEEILARYVAEYGEKVLSSPTHEGFNLLAWWGPYAALLVGAVTLTLAIRRIARRPVVSSDEASAAPATSPEQRARLERELEKVDS